jgi:hypothetical protein
MLPRRGFAKLLHLFASAPPIRLAPCTTHNDALGIAAEVASVPHLVYLGSYEITIATNRGSRIPSSK